ncbi:MAG: hypothetical protein RR161_02945 [Bacilli bacterium]
MKKLFSMVLAAVALLASGAASIGCAWVFFDEPESKNTLTD